MECDGNQGRQDGKPISEVVLQPVSLIGRESRGYQTPEETTATADASGRFEIRGLPGVRIQLRANKPGLHQEWYPREIAEVTLIFVAAVAVRSAVTVLRRAIPGGWSAIAVQAAFKPALGREQRPAKKGATTFAFVFAIALYRRAF